MKMKRIHSRANGKLFERITGREREILALIADHRSNKEIAASLHLALSTVKWYSRQIFSKLEVRNRREAVQRAVEQGLLGGNHEETIPNNLLAAMTSFVGREEEVETVIRLLTMGESRLVTLQGLGGSGKTRLAVEAASRLVKSANNTFSDGVWFVSLISAQQHDQIIQVIGNTTGYSIFDNDNEPLLQLINYLYQKHLLLILDNYEHLISEESNQLITEIMTRAPHIKILVTSRTGLNVLGEQLFHLTGMKTPQNENLPRTGWESFSAVQFFHRCARRVHPAFEITDGNLASVIRICQLVEGLPLGIELSATWLELLTPQQIATEIVNSLDFLSSEQANVPDRQRSIRAVFESSWNLLSGEEQRAFLRLCIFVGAFSSETAQQVSGASLQTLLKLANKSWLERSGRGRFQLHELMRQYGEEKLRTQEEEWKRAKDSHAAYFSDFIAEQSLRLRSSEQLAGLSAVHEEFDSNIKIAWEWLVSEQRWQNISEKMTLGLFHYAVIRMRSNALTSWLRHTKHFSAGSSEPVSYAILGTLELFCQDNSDARGYKWVERLTALWQLVSDHNMAEKLGFWYVLLAGMISTNNLIPGAKSQLEEAVDYARKHGDPWMLGMSLLIQSGWLQGFTPLEDPLVEAADIFEKIGVLYEQGLVAAMLEGLAIQQKRSLAEIKYYSQRKNRFFQKMNDLYPFLTGFFSSASDYFQIGEIDRGFSLFREQQGLFEEFGDMEKVAYSLHWESQFAVWYSTFEHARRTGQRALEIRRNLNQDSPWDLFELGEVYRVFGNQEKALDLYEQAHASFKKQNLILGLGYYCRACGDIAVQEARYSEAILYYQEYLRYAHQDNHIWSLAQAHAKLALAYAYLGNLNESRRELRTGLIGMRALRKDDLTLQALVAETLCLTQECRYEEAVGLSTFILTHPVSTNEIKRRTRLVLDQASRELPLESVRTAKEQAKKISIESTFEQYLLRA